MDAEKLKRRYIELASNEYEYSWAPEYERRAMTKRATTEGTVDIDTTDFVGSIFHPMAPGSRHKCGCLRNG